MTSRGAGLQLAQLGITETKESQDRKPEPALDNSLQQHNAGLHLRRAINILAEGKTLFLSDLFLVSLMPRPFPTARTFPVISLIANCLPADAA